MAATRKAITEQERQGAQVCPQVHYMVVIQIITRKKNSIRRVPSKVGARIINQRRVSWEGFHRPNEAVPLPGMVSI